MQERMQMWHCLVHQTDNPLPSHPQTSHTHNLPQFVSLVLVSPVNSEAGSPIGSQLTSMNRKTASCCHDSDDSLCCSALGPSWPRDFDPTADMSRCSPHAPEARARLWRWREEERERSWEAGRREEQPSERDTAWRESPISSRRVYVMGRG